MTTYAMKDAADLILVNKKTGKVDLVLDYANVTTAEWTADRVFATRKGTNAVAWDLNRAGTFSVESEMFDMKYLALILGSDVEEGTNGIMKRVVYEVDGDRKAPLAGAVNAEGISVVKLGTDLLEHVGDFLPSTLGAEALLPAQVKNFAVSINDSTALLNFDNSERAVSYDILRDGEVVGTTTVNTFTDTGLTPATEYEYTVVATNVYGKGAASPVVKATSAVAGVTERTQTVPTAQAIEAAALLTGDLTPEATNMATFTFSEGAVQFNENAIVGEHYAIYYTEEVAGTKTVKVSSDKFADSYEVYATSVLREVESGIDRFMQIKYFNARPQSNFSLTQDVNTPTALSVTFDLTPNKEKQMAEYVLID